MTRRSQSGRGHYPTIRREETGGLDSDEERGSGEYFSGEEFHEDDIMVTKDRYCWPELFREITNNISTTATTGYNHTYACI